MFIKKREDSFFGESSLFVLICGDCFDRLFVEFVDIVFYVFFGGFEGAGGFHF